MKAQPDRLANKLLLADIDLGIVILVAFSGGPDSTALLHQLHSGGYVVHAAHIHHGLRGEEADADAQYCAKFCSERGIPFTLLRVDIAGERERAGGGVQETARRLRYDALERCASEVGASLIAIAHNRDDNAETILLNILRGTGIDGLRGIPLRRGRIIRPLLHVSRAEIEAYCTEQGLEPRRDSSNDATKYARNEVRHELMPYLAERFNPRVQEALLRLSLLASDEGDYLDAEASRWLGTRQQIDRRSLSKLPPALQRRVLRLWLKEVRGLKNVSFEYIEQIRADTYSTGPVILPELATNAKRPAPQAAWISWSEASLPITIPSSAVFFGWEVSAAGSVPYGTGELIVRFWSYGDRMRFPFGRRKLSDLFGEAKWPEAERHRTPLLAEQESREVLAIANWRVSPLAPDLRFTAERVAPTAG